MSDTLVGTLAAGASLHAPETRSVIGRVLHPMRVYYEFGPPEPGGLRAVHFFAEELGLITVMARASEITPEATP